jgi:hypothetical protein
MLLRNNKEFGSASGWDLQACHPFPGSAAAWFYQLGDTQTVKTAVPKRDRG